MNDGVLVEALRARDPGALAALYDTYAENLYRYCRTMLAGPDAAQVALRDTLIAAEALVRSLADPDRFRVWLYTLARGECLRRRTPGAQDGPPEDGPAPVATAPFPGVIAGGAEADLLLVAGSAVAALSAEDREVLELAARHGLSTPELATVLGTGERYAEALLDAATERLREAVTAEILARRATHDCERASALLAGFTGELAAQVRAQLTRHVARCETCARHRVRQISPARVLGLLPPVALPETLRVRVLSSFIDPELVPYRRFVAKRVGGLNAAGFPKAGTRHESRLAQAVAGAVAALAAVATIALVFAQFSGELREEAADTVAPPRFPAAEAPVSPSAGSPEGSPGEPDRAVGGSRTPPVSGDLAEPVVPVRPAKRVALPRPAPLPDPAPPATARPRHPGPPAKPPGRPTRRPTSPPASGVSPSGPEVTLSPGVPSGAPSSTASRTPSGRPPGTGPGGRPTPGGSGPGGTGSGRPPRGGPPPAHWPHPPGPHPPGPHPPGQGHPHSPGREHQHHHHDRHRERPPTTRPSHRFPDGTGGPGAVVVRGGQGARTEARAGSEHDRPGGRTGNPRTPDGRGSRSSHRPGFP